MSMLQSIIAQSNTQVQSYPYERDESVTDIYRVGDRRSIFPCVLWQDGKTFFGANKINTSFHNQIQIFQYDSQFGSFEYKDVGNGTDVWDQFNHPLTWVWIENGTFYCGQINTHNDVIDRYKANLSNDIRSGFTKLTSISGENAYPQVFRTSNNKTAFCVRQYPEGVGNFNLSVQVSDDDIEGTFTKTVITENTVGYRHYNVAPIIYGTPTKNYIFTAFRNDDHEYNYFATACYVTTDFETFSNADGTFSKDITLDGELTMAEISANFLVNGTIAEDEVAFEIPSIIQVDDTIYFSQTKAGTTDKYLFKITDDGTVTDTIINIPDLRGGRNPILYYNGVKVVLSVRCDDGVDITKEIWACDLDLTGYAQQFVYAEDTSTNHIFLPDNLNEVNGEYACYLDQNTNELILLITDNKWI